jgi:pyrrolidone-carboxylate peptidase
MASLVVLVVGDDDETPLSGAVVSGGAPSGDGLDAEEALERAGPEGRFEVATEASFVVRVERDDAPGLALQVALDLTDDDRPAFVHGARPATMQLSAVRQGAGSEAGFVLRVRWSEVQEVVFASGTNPTENFASLSRGRFARLAKTGEVETSCVLTLFEFESNPPVGYPNATRTLTRRRYLVDTRYRRAMTASQLRTGAGALLMSQRVWTDTDEVSVTSVYSYLAEVGRTRVGTVREVGFFSHAYWIGPVLLNSGRHPARCNERKPWDEHTRCAPTGCHEHCPTDREHETLTRMQVPILRDYDPPYRYLARSGTHVRPFLNLVLAKRDPSHEGIGVHRRTYGDRDPRNTDFAGANMIDAPLGDMRAALHVDAILRVWGCNNGALGPLFRIWRKSGHRDQPNRRLRVAAQWQRHGDPAGLLWRPREGDARLTFLSRLRRCYAQALASALGRPCYGAVPGTYGEYTTAPLGAMKAMAGGLMAPFSLEQLYPDGVPEDDLSERDRRETRLRDGVTATPRHMRDAGGYFRFPPSPRRVPVELTVLVTGFLPFRGPTGRFPPFNSSGEAVRALAELDVLAAVNVPPWVDLTLRVEVDPEVNVVWSCAAERRLDSEAPEQASAPEGPGGADRVLAKAEEVSADIVIIVGESQGLKVADVDLRLERFASNVGTDKLADNAGYTLDTSAEGWRDVEDHGRRYRAGPILPRRDVLEKLESTVPLRAWLQCLARLRREPDGFTIHNGPGTNLTNSAGKFVCNETFYQVLIESIEGTRGLGRRVPGARTVPATGRWVEMVHVASQLPRENARAGERGQGPWVLASSLDEEARDAHARLARGLAAVAASLVEGMLWATDVGDLEIKYEGETTPIWPAPIPPDWFQLTIRDDAGEPAREVALTLTASDGNDYQATTNDQGVARWEGLPPGRVSFELPDGLASLDHGEVEDNLGPAEVTA